MGKFEHKYGNEIGKGDGHEIDTIRHEKSMAWKRDGHEIEVLENPHG